jgi:hypothetical protein
VVNDSTHEDSLSRTLADWAAEEAKQPVRITARMLRLKSDLARSDRARANAGRIERWAFGLSGIVLLLASLGPVGNSLDGSWAMAAEGVLGLMVLATAAWSLARSLLT